MNVKLQPNPLFIRVKPLGQIGAGKVVEFIPRENRKWIPLPKNAKQFHQFSEYEVCGDSLSDIGIFDGNLLTCRINFEIWEIKPNKVCVVRILTTGEQIAKMVSLNNDGTITLSGASADCKTQIYFADEIEILALVVEVRRSV